MKYDLVGIDGNAFCIMGYVMKAMKECKFSKTDRDAYFKDATSSNYDHLLCVSVEMIDKCNEIADDMLISKLQKITTINGDFILHQTLIGL